MIIFINVMEEADKFLLISIKSKLNGHFYHNENALLINFLLKAFALNLKKEGTEAKMSTITNTVFENLPGILKLKTQK